MNSTILRRTVAVWAICFLFVSGVIAASKKPAITVMTYNMDSGTDLQLVFYFMESDPTLGVQLTYEELMAAGLPQRAALLADQIAAKQPDLVALEEATLWRTGPTIDTAEQPLFDQLQLLLDALAARGRKYTVVAKNELTDAALPMSSTFALRYTDRDVLLARSDLRRSDLDISNVQIRRYTNTVSFFGMDALRGWISADVTVSGTTFRFAATHLESTYAQYPEITAYQVAQAQELLEALKDSPFPVILAGDFNSNAEPTPYEQTPTIPLILSSGYTDVWRAAHPGAAGFTWPLFLQDPMGPNPNGPYERIDLIFSRGLAAEWVKQVGAEAPFASDHAGVTARFLLEP